MATLGEYLGAGSGTTLALYHLENTTDSSGNGRTLTNNNSVAFNAAKFSNGADFGASGNTKSLSIGSALGYSANITMSCWVKLNTEITSSYYVFLNLDHLTTRVAFRMYYDYNSGTRRLYFGRTKLGVADNLVLYNQTLGTTNWNHFLMTYDGSNCRVYMNGNLFGTVASSGNGTFTSFTDNFSIGNTKTTYQNGHIIDEVIVENRAWSASEIKKYYTFARGRFGII